MQLPKPRLLAILDEIGSGQALVSVHSHEWDYLYARNLMDVDTSAPPFLRRAGLSPEGKILRAALRAEKRMVAS